MKLLVRADASTAIGSGHVMRCLALAQSWQDWGGEVLFVMAEGAEAMGARLEDEKIAVDTISTTVNSVEDARQTLFLAKEYQADWLVVDGYRFDADYQRRLREGGGKLLVLDDFGQASFYCADLVLNQNAHADESFYPSRLPATRLLLGLEYALLRREFYRRPLQVGSDLREARHLLLTCGGGDPHNLTGRVVSALQKADVPDLEIVAVIGVNNPHRSSLEGLCRDSVVPIRLQPAVRDMTELYDWADLAISGGGSTLWELAYMGIPALVLILADNQEPSSHLLDRLGSVRCLGRSHQLSDKQIVSAVTELCRHPEARRAMTTCGRRLVDGRGGARVVAAMLGDTVKRGNRCNMS